MFALWGEWLVKIAVKGPDPVDFGQPPGFMRTLFPWPVRWLLVLAAGIIGWVWADAGIAEQLSWGLDYAALIGVSLSASYWRPILIINLVLSLAWFVPFRSRQDYPNLWRLLHVVTFLNRQVGHFEALIVWLALALVAWPKLSFQLPFATGVVLLGPPVINGLARIRWTGNGGRASGNLNWRRRPFIYAATLIGLFVLAVQARHQVAKLMPVIASIVIGGLAPRLIRSLLRGHNVKAEAQAQLQERLDERATFRASQMNWARLDVTLGPVLILFLAVGAIAFAWQQRRAFDAIVEQQVNPSAGGDGRSCLRDPGGPAKPEASLFIVSDTQLHELQGRRFPGQIELADVFVPVAIRPVELDLLSVATWARFGNVYRQLATDFAAGAPSLSWAHLGDFADLSCVGEMTRAMDMLGRFGDGHLAGVAPGNHDKSFTGNFFWSPFWDVACAKRLEKKESDAMLRAAVIDQPQGRRRLIDGAIIEAVPDGGGIFSRQLSGRGSALVTVSPLGVVHHRHQERGLIGVFLDTADEKSFDFGIAGLFGTVSPQQIKTLLGMIHELQRTSPAAYRDPVYLLFGHHPLDEIRPESQKRIARFISRLDRAADPTTRTGPGGDDDTDNGADVASSVDVDGQPSPRVLALITAHTHLARAGYHCMGNRYVREIVVGSTVDPPQEASLLTVGADDQGVASVRLRTLPAVAREGRTCGAEPAVSTLQCQQAVGALAEEAECRALFESDAGPGLPSANRAGLRPDCQVLEKSMSLTERLMATRGYRGPDTAEGIKKAQVVRARRLFACLCRRGRCTPPPAALALEDDRSYHEFFLHALEAGDPAARQTWETELTCLSWAASAVQAHKSAGMTIADALRCGFDDATLPPAKEYVTVLEARSCE